MGTMLVGEGTHYEKALSWVKVAIGDNIKMPDGSIFKLEKKNAKSAVCIDDAGESVNIPIKKLLPNGSDAYVSSVVRQLQDSTEITFDANTEDYFQDSTLPNYECSDSLSLARRLIRANRCSTDPMKDILEHLANKLSKQDAGLSSTKKKMRQNWQHDTCWVIFLFQCTMIPTTQLQSGWPLIHGSLDITRQLGSLN